jgi:hypothetical protein
VSERGDDQPDRGHDPVDGLEGASANRFGSPGAILLAFAVVGLLLLGLLVYVIR